MSEDMRPTTGQNHGAAPNAPNKAEEPPDLFWKETAGREEREQAERWKDLPPEPDDPELVALRGQLFRREIAIINKLKLMLDSGQYSATAISKVISEAIVIRAAKDERMLTALEPLVENIVTESMRLHREDFVNALFPLMGPSIRKSIAENFRSMLGNFSKSLEMALSWKGLRWRLEAMRSGKPFSDIVLLHTLIYRVEQVFFIHSKTGLVLSHLFNEGVGSQDADMVSAMLTAIQDFVRDCFANGQKGELESLQMGEFTIFIEKSPQAYLACVVRGTPPADFRESMRGALDNLLVEYGPQLAAFNGDDTPFRHSIRFLEDFIVARYVDDEKPLPFRAKALPAALILLLVCGVGTLKWRSHTEERQLNEAIGLLRGEPGIMVVHVDDSKGKPWQVLAFKDDLARSPTEILAGKQQAGQLSFRLVPFVSYDPAIVERRVRERLALPEGVNMDLDNGVLMLSGTTSFDWILKTRELAYSLPGISRVDVSGLEDPRMAEMAELIREIEQTRVEFPTGKAQPVASDGPKLEKAVSALVKLENLAAQMGLSTSLTVYGHADSTGTEQANYEISRARTQTLAAMLYARGSGMPIAMYGMGSQYPKGGEASAPGPDQASRRIELRVHLLQSVQSLSASGAK